MTNRCEPHPYPMQLVIGSARATLRGRSYRFEVHFKNQTVKFNRIAVPHHCAQGVLVEDVMINRRSVLAVGGLPGEMFSSDGYYEHSGRLFSGLSGSSIDVTFRRHRALDRRSMERRILKIVRGCAPRLIRRSMSPGLSRRSLFQFSMIFSVLATRTQLSYHCNR